MLADDDLLVLDRAGAPVLFAAEGAMDHDDVGQAADVMANPAALAGCLGIASGMRQRVVDREHDRCRPPERACRDRAEPAAARADGLLEVQNIRLEPRQLAAAASGGRPAS